MVHQAGQVKLRVFVHDLPADLLDALGFGVLAHGHLPQARLPHFDEQVTVRRRERA